MCDRCGQSLYIGKDGIETIGDENANHAALCTLLDLSRIEGNPSLSPADVCRNGYPVLSTVWAVGNMQKDLLGRRIRVRDFPLDLGALAKLRSLAWRDNPYGWWFRALKTAKLALTCAVGDP